MPPAERWEPSLAGFDNSGNPLGKRQLRGIGLSKKIPR
jgi:hypothetical protein